ncbi:hypothetical protein SAMN02745136_00922 [Anaerocolumna jejuensis DSM 15929]|uniref:Uncharacterized protein n=1 Tax=Anaerocolumna jejuensis DSM 15929 TaxID=1121322 RepID=A0A1M6MAJ2_9FIRM|nr:hypothetical protein [Anaerocolumna jejuensis]SHJ80441.1 hypothetical protein SAMN02745136_00922 [Anaerocolumna jejuensis DSM 15929]
MKDIFGIYNIRSRISVVIVFLAPLIIQSYILVPEIRNLSSTLIITFVAYALSGLIILFSRRKSGKILNECFPNGLPAQQYLMPSNSHLNKCVKERYYNFFKNHLADFTLSQNDEEMKKQTDSAVTWLISQTRNSSKFPLIAEENMDLGFAYNLLGIKSIGICLCTLMLIFNSITIVAYCKFDLTINLNLVIYCLISDVLCLMMWIILINKSLVISCAKKYAHALLSSCDAPELNTDLNK